MANQLSNLFRDFMNKYVIAVTDLSEKELGKSLKKSVTKSIPNIIKNYISSETYSVKGSVGYGEFAKVPWISILNKNITSTTQEGVYVVYLLNKDNKELYLTLNMAAKDPALSEKNLNIDSSIKPKVKKLRIIAERIRYILGTECVLDHGEIITGSKDYDAGCIYYKKYDLESLPDNDEDLFNDLKKFLEAYDLYYNKIFKSENVPASEDDGTEDSIKTILEGIKKYIVSKGFVYDQKLIDNFYISLKTKPFVLLAGTSGTGKTRLVRLFAEAIGAMDEGRYLQVPVRPDWSDSTDLFGHVNLNNQFIPGVIIDFIKNAYENKDMPYILCLDEMNLARVEYYLSDFLSIIETRDWKGNEIVTDELVPKMCFSGDKDAEKKYKHMIFPENLYLIGTVNMDETTFPFSKKVLDRANTIEFSSVDFDLPDPLSDGESPAEKVFVKNDFLRSDYLRLLKDCTDFEEIIRRQNEQISKINEILKESDVHFGYRMRDDMIFYMLYNTKSDLINEDEAFDNQINQKILPRIHGGSESVAKILRRLFSEICAGPYEDNSSTKDSYKMENYMKENNCIYPKSAEKIWKMLRRFEEDDFTSYWI